MGEEWLTRPRKKRPQGKGTDKQEGKWNSNETWRKRSPGEKARTFPRIDSDKSDKKTKL